MKNLIKIKGAKEHNLKNISLNIEKNKFVVITGVSGSGKSTLAFDIIYSEGQRRYVESLSSYARQFIGKMTKPNVESIEGLSPAVSIEQKTVNKNPRSTVGTLTEIYDYLRLLYANIGVAYCPKCGKKVQKITVDEIITNVFKNVKDKTQLIISSPIVEQKKGEHKNLFINLLKLGIIRAKVDKKEFHLDDEINLDKNKRHNIDAIIDRVVFKKEDKIKKRLYEAILKSFSLSNGKVKIEFDGSVKIYSQNFACPKCDISFPEINARMFSFNAPYGACPECKGLGENLVIDPEKLIINNDLSIKDGGLYIPGANTKKGYNWKNLQQLCKHYKIDLDKPVKELKESELDIIFFGSKGKKFKFSYSGKNLQFTMNKSFEGIANNLKRRHMESQSESMREEIEKKYMKIQKCEACHGQKLNPIVLAIKINKKNISEITELSVEKLYKFILNLKLSEKEKKIAAEILKEVKSRVEFLLNVGLSYLSLSRRTKTLSGGESQRIRLATQIGIGLTGVIYVLDEPSIGLHQRDNKKLLKSLKKLRDLGNTLIVVEHDEETILESDYVIDIGPKAGIFGGEIVAHEKTENFIKNANSLTAKYLRKELKIEKPSLNRKPEKYLELYGAVGNNLKNIDVSFPLKTFIAITGVSGSGKSTLINQTLFPALFNKLNKGKLYPLEYREIKGMEYINKVVGIDQSPIGRTPRSNPATYTKIFDTIRDIFAQTKDAKISGFNKGHFSFNVKGGRCEACQGAGIIKIEMNFLPDVYIECEVCKGKKYHQEILEVKYKDKNIYDVLEMTVLQAYDFFESIPKLKRKLKLLKDVGLDYIKLGQSALTLSGGEAQRVKLSSELSKNFNKDNIYILDEPTTGLHFHDVSKLLSVLNKLVEKGNTVIVIEHNLDVINMADYIIDLGPEGGEKGGEVLAFGTPSDIIANKRSYTGKYLND